MEWKAIGIWYLPAFTTFLIALITFLKCGWLITENGDISVGVMIALSVIFIMLFTGATCGISHQLKREKVTPVEIPEFDCFITSPSLNYVEGLQVDGIVWQKDFREYTLRVRNKSKQADTYDVRIDMDMLGAIVNYKVLSQQGCEEIFFSRNLPDRFDIAKKGVIVETNKLYSDNLQINTAKMYPEGSYVVKLVAKTLPVEKDFGIFIIKYRYLNTEGKKIKQSFVYKILAKNNKSLYIDTANPIPGKFERTQILIPGEKYELVKEHRSAIKYKPDSAETHNNLGITYAQAGQKDKAIEEFKLAIKYKPDFAEAHNNLGAQLGQKDKAIEEFKLAIKYKPDFAEVHNNFGIAYAQTGKPDKAIEEFRLAIKYKPDHAWAHYNLGVTYKEQGKPDKAIEEFRLAIKYKPDFAEAHNNLGITYAQTGQIDKAIEEFKLAIKYKPDHAEAYNNLDTAYTQTGKPDEAIE
jgi:tetratricopeptide (TPR) repeat protein